tara:strand:- start:342 stop:458 length:117 start_codon:yes stop_codon:yes gene_type:complete
MIFSAFMLPLIGILFFLDVAMRVTLVEFLNLHIGALSD